MEFIMMLQPIDSLCSKELPNARSMESNCSKQFHYGWGAVTLPRSLPIGVEFLAALRQEQGRQHSWLADAALYRALVAGARLSSEKARRAQHVVFATPRALREGPPSGARRVQ